MDDERYGGPVVERVRTLVAPILADLGLVLYDCEHTGGTLRVTIARPAGSAGGGLDLEVISLVTRLVGRELDHDDPIPGRYTLEVSSPGLERTLRRRDHFRDALGELVNVRLHQPVGGTRRIQGTLGAVDSETITLDTEDGPVSVGYEQIERARTVFVWGPGPKPGGPKPGGPNRSPKRKASSAAPAPSAPPETTITTTGAGGAPTTEAGRS